MGKRLIGRLRAIFTLILLATSLGAQSNVTFQYFYDDAGQLIKVVDSAGNVVSYNYDAVGNLLSITRATLPSTTALAIFNVTPQRGVEGATVTIQGQGFSTTPANNIVQFNGTAATVTSATTTQLVTAVPTGATTGPVSVTVGGVKVQGLTFTVLPHVVSIAITPTNPTIPLGSAQQFTATGTLSDGSTQNLTASVTWSSSDTSVARISNLLTTAGLASSVGIGITTITATSGSLTAFTTLKVTAAGLVSIDVSPANLTVPPGEQVQFTATGVSSNGTTQDLTATATWSSSNTSVATISNAPGSQGLATAVAAGTTTITATQGSVSGSTTLTVNPFALRSGITTVAGGGPNNVPGASGNVAQPYKVIADGRGNIFFVDRMANRVFKLDSSGQLTVAAGSGAFFNPPGPSGAFSGDGSVAINSELNLPFGVAVDSSGNLFIADSGNNRVRRVDVSTGIITTVAGNGTAGSSGDGGAATSAQLNTPFGVAVDSSGNLFIADNSNQRIRRVDVSTGIITTVAGNGTAGFTGDGGPATTAELNSPEGLALDALGNLFIADASNSRVRRVDASTGIITTVAGNGNAGFNGDGILATSASLDQPEDVVVDASGNLFVADTVNNRIRRVDAATQIITTVAGNGPTGFPGPDLCGDGGPAVSACLSLPVGVTVDSVGNVFLADVGNTRIRRVDAATQIITTVAGNGSQTFCCDGDLGTRASFSSYVVSLVNFDSEISHALAVDKSGNVFLADFNGGTTTRVRRVDAASGIITTVAGTATRGFSGDGGPATSAQFAGILGVAVDSSDNLFISDGFNGRIRRVDAATSIVTTVAGGGSCSVGVGDGGPATSACLNLPEGLAFDSSGNLFIADAGNSRVRRVDASTGIITTVAGNGNGGFSGDGGPATSAMLSAAGVALDAAGNLFIADWCASRIRRVDAATNIITTVAGSGFVGPGCFSNGGFGGDGGPATSAMLRQPMAVAVDSSGNLFIADTENQRIRRVDHSTQFITTVAGNGTAGFNGDNLPPTSAELAVPFGVAVDSSGNLFILDSENVRIRLVGAGSIPSASLSNPSFPFRDGYTSALNTTQAAKLGAEDAGPRFSKTLRPSTREGRHFGERNEHPWRNSVASTMAEESF